MNESWSAGEKALLAAGVLLNLAILAVFREARASQRDAVRVRWTDANRWER